MKRDSVQNLLPPELVALARVCQALMTVLNARLFTLLGMLLCAGAFGYVLWQPDWIRFAGACAFAALVYLPIVRIENGRIVQQENDNG